MKYFLPRPSARITKSPVILQEIRERAFGFSEVPDADGQQGRDNTHAHEEARQIKLALATQQAPTEPIDHTYDRIQAVKHSPFFRHHGGRKTHRRYIKTKLQNERNDIAEVAI